MAHRGWKRALGARHRSATSRRREAAETVDPSSLIFRIIRLVVWAVGIVVVVLVGLVLMLQVNAVSTLVGRGVVSLLSSPAMALSVDEVTGSWVGGLRVTGFRISSFSRGEEAGGVGPATRMDSAAAKAPVPLTGIPRSPEEGGAEDPGPGPGWEVSADTLSLSYRLLPLLRKTLAVKRLEGSGVRVVLRLAEKKPDSLRPSEAAPPGSSEESGWTIQGREITVRRGALRMETLPRPSGAGSTLGPWILDETTLLARDFSLGNQLQIAVDSLLGRLMPSGEAGPEGRILAAGAFGPEHLLLDTLLFETSESDLRARGHLPLDMTWPPSRDVDMNLAASPLLLRDLRPFLPAGVPDSIRILAEGHAGNREGAFRVDLNARTSGAARLEIQSSMVPKGSPGSSALSLHLEGLDLGAWGLAQQPRLLAASLEARSDSLAGPWTGEWSTRSPGVEASGSGSLTLGTPLEWEVEGKGSWSPEAGAPPLAGLDPGGVTLVFDGSGRGTDLGELRGEGGVRMTSGTLGDGLAESLALNATVEGGNARLSISGMVAQGSLRGGGDVNLASLPNLEASGELRLAGAQPRGVRVDSLDVRLEARDSLFTVMADLQLPDSARARMVGGAILDSRGQRLQVDSVRFARVDLRNLLSASGDTAGIPETRLSGILRGSGGLDRGGWAGEGTLQMDSSMVGGEAIRSGRIEARVDSLGGRVTLDLATAEGRLSGEARVVSWEPTPSFSVPEMRFRALDAGALLGRESDVTRVSGTLQGELQGSTLAEMTGNARLALDSSRILGRELTRATLDGRLDSGDATLNLEAEGGGVVIRLDGTSRLADSILSYRAEGSVHGRPDSATTFAARFGLEGTGRDPDSMEARAWADVDSASWNEVVLDRGRAEASLERGLIRLDTLALESAAASVSGGGSLPLSGSSSDASDEAEIRLRATLHRADMLAGPLGAEIVAVGEAEFQARAAGTLADLSLSGEGRVSALLIDATQLQGGELSFDAHRTREDGFTTATAELTVDRFRTGTFPIQSLDAAAELGNEGTELSVSASAIIDGNRQGTVQMTVEEVSAPSTVKIESLDFSVDEDQWALLRPARVSLKDGFQIDSLVLEAGDQRIFADGRAGRTGALDLTAEVKRFRIGTVSDLLGVPALQGDLSGSLGLAGSADAPELEARLQGMLTPEDAEASELELTTSYRERSLSFEARVAMGGQQGFRVSGSLPMVFSLSDTTRGFLDSEAMTAEARVDSLPLTWFGLFLPSDAVRNLEGVADGTLRLEGTPGDPALEGELALARVGVGLPSLGLRYGRGQGRMRFQGDRIVLDTLQIHSGGGVLRGSGSVRFPSLSKPEYDLRVRARDFRAVSTSGMMAVVSGDVEVSGNPMSPSVTGDLEVLESDLYLGDLNSNPDQQTVALSDEDYRELARVFGYRRPGPVKGPSNTFRNSSLDLSVTLRRDSWVRQRANPELAIQFSGDLSIQKAAGDSIRLVGEVSAIPERSYVEQFGRRFSLTQGELVFQGAPSVTRVDLRAEYEVPSRDNPQSPEVVIALDITGTPEDLRLDLSSTPPLEASDMVSYLAVGRPADQSLSGGEGGSLTGTGGALALNRLSGAVEAYAREQVGLDVVEITTDGLDGVTLLAGRYVSPDLYLGIRQPISLQRGSGESSERTPDPEFEAELQALRWLLLNLQAGGRTGVELFVRTRISYE